MIGPQTVLNNRYRLEKLIGEGGFARVFLGTHLELARPVAVKVLNSEMAQDPEFLGRFRQEARSIAALEHPNILSVYDYGEFEGSPYLVMPYIDGGTLQDRLRRGPLAPQEAGQLLEQICAALDYAHSRNIVHRDVKPQNMLMRLDGRLWLTDFGIAKLLTEESGNSMTRPLGTLSYMAPEQIDGHVNRQSDTYAVGVVLYQMLTGQLPFTGTTSQVLTGHYTQPVPSLVGQPALRHLPPATLQQLDRVIGRAMAKNPQERFQNGAEFVAAYKAGLTAASAPNINTAETVVATPIQVRPNTPAYQNPPPAPQPNYPPAPPPNYPPAPNYTPQPTMPLNFQVAPPPNYQNQPPRKNNTLLFAVGGGIGALVIIGIILAVVLGGPKGGNGTPTPVAAVSPTGGAVTQTTAASQTSAATTTGTGSTTTSPAIVLTTEAADVGATTAVPTTAAPTTAAPTTVAATLTVPATTKAAATPTTAPVTTRVAATTPAGSSSSSSLKPPDGYDLYKTSAANKLNLEMAYPKGWSPSAEDDNNLITITSQDGTATFTVQRSKTGATGKTVDEYNADFINSLKQEGWKPRTADTRFFGFAGEKWIQSSYQKDSDRLWGLFALHNGVPYRILLEGDDSTFDNYLEKEFSTMFDYMHFLDSPVNIFVSEIKSYDDPKTGNYTVNYPIDTYDVSLSNNSPYVTSKDKNSTFYMYDVTTTSLSVGDVLLVYKDKLANSGYYENFKTTGSVEKEGDYEQTQHFTYTYKGNTYQAELLVHKQGKYAYVGVSVSNGTKDTDLNKVYFNIWRYIVFKAS